VILKRIQGLKNARGEEWPSLLSNVLFAL